MRKTLLTICFIIPSLFVFGQSAGFGFKAGVSLSNQSIKSFGTTTKSTYLLGFHAGAIFDINILDNETASWSIQPGLFYSNKGYQYNQALSNGNQTVQKPIEGKIQMNYLELPLNILYKTEVTRTIKVYFGGGGYVGYGLSGTYAVQNQKSDISFTKSIDGYQYKNPDYGINAVIGTQLSKNVIIDANYSLGLNNLCYYQGTTIHNRSMGLSVGYFF
ncbi:MAG: PorT family protein [Mucilaginibacter sp.]|nr:PorT family protein [Mucilaginibacter sp.]